MSPSRSKDPSPTGSPVAARIRARAAELGMSESALAKACGWHRSVLSSLLRRLDAEPTSGLRDDTIAKLEIALGKPGQWIRTGIEPAGVRLADCPGWADAARVAAERYGIPAETIALVGEGRLPRAVRFVDPGLIRALSDAL